MENHDEWQVEEEKHRNIFAVLRGFAGKINVRISFHWSIAMLPEGKHG